MSDSKEKTRPVANAVLQPGKQIIAENNLPPNLTRMVKQVFHHPQNWSDGIFRSPLSAVAEFLVANGVSRSNLRSGLLTYLSLNSVKLGHPMSIVLRTEDKAVASHLLLICKQIAPRDSFAEVRDLKPEQLYASKDFFRNKALICEDVASIKKALPDLLGLITQGRAARQCDFKSKFGGGIQSFTAEYKVAFIGVENSDAESLIDHPSVIKVPVRGSGHT
ncbi:MAG TPA: hypothetical protein ACFCUC_18510, partial [Desulfobacterales bacterium]